MDCQANINLNCGAEILRKIYARSAMERTPISGSLEITHRCNLRCKHCYLGPQSEVQKKAQQSESSTAEILKTIDAFTSHGCLYLLLTGGEPLLHQDFAVIYQHVIKSGLFVRLFTNATLITPQILDLFKKYPPKEIEVTLYGATQETYESVTGIPGSYQKCLQGIRDLLLINMPVSLKTVVLTLNKQDFFAMEKMAADFGVPFRFDGMIQPRLDGDKMPLVYRLQPKELVALDFSDEKRKANWLENSIEAYAMRDVDTMYECCTGRTGFHIDPYGKLMSCVGGVKRQYSLREASFQSCWEKLSEAVTSVKKPENFICTTCAERSFCVACPKIRYLETNSETECPQYYHQLSEERKAQLARDKSSILYFNLAGSSFAFKSPYPLFLIAHANFYEQFVSLDAQEQEVDLAVNMVIEDFFIDASWQEVPTYEENCWRIYSNTAEFLLQMKPWRGNLPHWTLRFDRGMKSIIVYCSKNSVAIEDGKKVISGVFHIPLLQTITIHYLLQQAGILLHATGAIINNNGYVFAGVSGAGKSTLAKLLVDHNCGEVLVDEKLIVRRDAQSFGVYGSPWPSLAQTVKNKGAALAGIFFIAHGGDPDIRGLTAKEALRKILPVVSVPWYDDVSRDVVFKILEQVVSDVPVYEFSYRPDKAAIDALSNFLR